MNIEELAERHANDFPGYRLTDLYEAAFPSYALQLQVLMQVKRPLPVLEEFILRAVDAGQISVPDIAGLLGLEYGIVEVGLDQLQRRDYVFFQIPREHAGMTPILITQKGRGALHELYLTEPQPSNYPVCIDALTGQLYLWQPLRLPSDIRKLEIHEIPACVSTPSLDSLDFVTLKRLVRQSQRDLPQRSTKRELVEILGIEKRWTAYRIMRILQYVRSEDGAIQVQVFDRGDRSIEHEAALITMEGKRLRPLRAMMRSEVPQPDLEEDRIIDSKTAEAARQKAVEAPRLNKEIRAKQQILAQVKVLQGSKLAEERVEASFQGSQLLEDIARLETRLKRLEADAGSTEVLQMHQHRPILLKAIQEAERRVIIVSPWLRPDAVDQELRQEIGRALTRGVNIIIAYGFGEIGHLETKTVRALKQISERKKGKLGLHRIGDLHSKVLISDDEFMVLSSFNWLSFAGDPARGSRVEDGMLTRDKKAIADKTQEWLSRIADVPPT